MIPAYVRQALAYRLGDKLKFVGHLLALPHGRASDTSGNEVSTGSGSDRVTIVRNLIEKRPGRYRSRY